jgi:hypothetical protein
MLRLALAACPGTDSWTLPIQIEEAGGYPGNPSTLALPLRQDLNAIELVKTKDRYTLKVQGGTQPLVLADADLALFIPRVPSYARKNDDLLRFALLQREFNRNEIKFGPLGELADFKLANNCLKTGLWELMLDKKVETGNAMTFHGWFAFPSDEYGRLFEAANGRPFTQCANILAQYPAITGMPAPLGELRKVLSERKSPITNHSAEAPIRFGEQKRKAKLLLTSDIATYADYSAAKNQPIRTARFSEPGFYDSKNPVEFDLTWLASPASATLREVELVQGGARATEVEIAYANGTKLVIADKDLASLPAREAAPDNDKDTLSLTFGIGTPDIYATLAERTSEAAAERPNWLMLLGADGKHLDNHQSGVDRVFCWNEGGKALHLYLIGYERIAAVGHLSLALGAD